MLLLGLNLSIYQSIIQDINRFYRLDEAASGIMVTIYFLGSLIAPAIAGEIGDRAGKRVVMITSGVVLVSGVLILALAQFLAVAIVGIVMIGAGGCTIEGLLSAQITDINPHSSEKFMTLSQTFYCTGAVLGPMLTLLVKTLGGDWRIALLINAAVFLPAVLSLIRLQNDKKTANPSKIKRDGAYTLTLIKDVRFLLFFFSMLLCVGAECGVAFFVTGYFSGSGAALYGEIALSLFWGGMIIGRLFTAIFHKRSGMIMYICLISTVTVSLLLQIEHPPVLLIVLFCLQGLSMSAVWPLIMSFCTRVFSKYSGTAGGLLIAGGSLGGMLLPALMGVLVHSSGSVRSALIITTAAESLIIILNSITRRLQYSSSSQRYRSRQRQ
jgi:FHS family glucose/mannose:H+ symporter-like MFS transporter